MKKISILSACILLALSLSFFSFKKETDLLKSDFNHYFIQSTGHLLSTYDSLYHYLNENNRPQLIRTKQLFEKVRYAYKGNELMLEYFAPQTAAMLNMALIPDVDEYDPNQYTQEPEGLQSIEELLYETDTLVDYQLVLQEMKRTRGVILRAQQIAKSLEPTEYQIFEACKLEIIRVWTINLTGIDAAYTKNSISESIYALQSMHDIIVLVKKNQTKRASHRITKQLLSQLNLSIDYLKKNNDFDTFNRIEFVKEHANTIYAMLIELEETLPYSSNPLPTAINYKKKNIFNNDAWNTYFFSSEKRNTVNGKQIALGKLLFFDPVLSGNNKRACASCHRPEYAFAEPLATSLKFNFEGQLDRNAPSLLNVAFQRAFFYDARIMYLEDQVVDVNQNVNEMHGNFQSLVKKLEMSEEYKLLFKQAFAGTKDSLISKEAIIKALAVYERSLLSLNSRFDQYMRNEKVTFTESEINGFNLFMGKAQCGTCHFAPFFNGTVPPFFEDTEWEILGVPTSKENKTLDKDLGRYNVAKMDIHKYAFKTPSVRNIEYTAPYMHNGVYTTLEEVLDFYNKGGGQGLGYEVPNQTLPADSLGLNKKEINDIISFMKTLNDTSGLTSKPSRLPMIIQAGQPLERTIGGDY